MTDATTGQDARGAPRSVKIDGVTIGGGARFALIAGPCVIEDQDSAIGIARTMKEICSRLDVPYIFKSSFDKANRTSLDSYRGPGLEMGLRVLASVREEVGIPVTSDVHNVAQVPAAAEALDMIQIPAFLCRQSDLLLAASATGLPVNVKKGQFLAPGDVRGIMGKVRDGVDLLITERGTSFGYHNLVVDFRSFPIIRRELRLPLVYDATHSVQLPGKHGNRSGGEREFIPYLCRAAVACGVDAIFMEVHPEPDRAPCDGPNMWPLGDVESLLSSLLSIRGSFGKGSG